MKATKKTQRQYITDSRESYLFMLWYNAQPKDPAKVYADPVAAFRADYERKQQE